MVKKTAGPLAGLFLLCGLLYFYGLGDIPFYTKGEPREGVVVWEILRTGEWILPLRNGEEIPSKPLLFHWLAALASLARGHVEEWTIRLPSAVLGTLGVLLTFWTGRRRWGMKAGMIAALILATSFEWVRAAVTARVDMTLTFFTVAALFLFQHGYEGGVWHRWHTWLFFTSCGLATLAKGPVGVVLPSLVVGIFLMLQRDLRFVKKMFLWEGTAVFLAVAATWYGLAAAKGGEAFVSKHIWQENFLRFFATASGGTGHLHSWYYFLPALVLGMVPWSFFLPSLGIFLYGHRQQLAGKRLLYPLVWCAVVFVFYSFSTSKRSVYILPLYPAVALLLGVSWQFLMDRVCAVPLSARFARLAGYLSVATMLFFTAGLMSQRWGYDLLSAIGPFLHPKDQENLPLLARMMQGHAATLTAWVLGAWGATVFLLYGLRGDRWTTTFSTLTAFSLATYLAIHRIFHPALAADRTFKPFMEQIVREIAEPSSLFFYRAFDYGAVFYSRRHIPAFRQDLCRSDRTCLLLMWEEEWPRAATHFGGAIEKLAVSEGTGPKGNHRLLLARIKSWAET